jgi:hypothetical protein
LTTGSPPSRKDSRRFGTLFTNILVARRSRTTPRRHPATPGAGERQLELLVWPSSHWPPALLTDHSNI